MRWRSGWTPPLRRRGPASPARSRSTAPTACPTGEGGGRQGTAAERAMALAPPACPRAYGALGVYYARAMGEHEKGPNRGFRARGLTLAPDDAALLVGLGSRRRRGSSGPGGRRLSRTSVGALRSWTPARSRPRWRRRVTTLHALAPHPPSPARRSTVWPPRRSRRTPRPDRRQRPLMTTFLQEGDLCGARAVRGPRRPRRWSPRLTHDCLRHR